MIIKLKIKSQTIINNHLVITKVARMMNEAQRHEGILSLLEENHSITVGHIIEQFGISPATARRDISKLDEIGKLKKVRNGAERIKRKR